MAYRVHGGPDPAKDELSFRVPQHLAEAREHDAEHEPAIPHRSQCYCRSQVPKDEHAPAITHSRQTLAAISRSTSSLEAAVSCVNRCSIHEIRVIGGRVVHNDTQQRLNRWSAHRRVSRIGSRPRLVRAAGPAGRAPASRLPCPPPGPDQGADSLGEVRADHAGAPRGSCARPSPAPRWKGWPF